MIYRQAARSIFVAVVLCARVLFTAPLLAEHIAFSADSMTGTAGSSSDTTVLKGNSYILTSSIEIEAESITMSGKNFRYVDAEGSVNGKNTESRLLFKCASVHCDRQEKLFTFKDDVSLTDEGNKVDVKAQIVEYDQNTDIAMIQINAVITQKDNICKSAFAVYKKKEQMLELNGNAQIKRGGDTFSAQFITLDLNTQQITLDGRVKGTVSDNKGNSGKESGGE